MSEPTDITGEPSEVREQAISEPNDVTGELSEDVTAEPPVYSSMEGVMQWVGELMEYTYISLSSSSYKSQCSCHTLSNQDVE